MNRFLMILLSLGCCMVSPRMTAAQGTRADYERSADLPRLTSGKVFHTQVNPHWSAEGNSFWFRDDGPDGEREYYWVDAQAGTRTRAFDDHRLAAALSQQQGRELNPLKLSIDGIEAAVDGNRIVRIGGKRWNVNLQTYELTPAGGSGAADTGGDSLPLMSRVHPSETGEETTITFINRTNAAVNLFWVDPGGKRVAYGKIDPKERREQNTYAGHVWVITDQAGKQIAAFEAASGGGDAVIEKREAPATLPDGAEVEAPGTETVARPIGFVRNDNVFLRDAKSGDETQLTTDGRPGDSYSGDFIWSPDGTKFVAFKTLDGDHRRVYVVQSSPPDQLQPKLESYEYLKPGDRIPMSKPHLFDARGKREIHVSDDLFPTPWRVEDVRWDADSSRFTFFYNQRGHQVLRIIAVSASDGSAKPIIDERSKTFIDYAGKSFVHYVDQTHKMIWMSERDGWNHLYLYDARTASVKNQITKGHWVVRRVDKVDEARRQIWFEAGGIYPDQDPYYIHFCRINFDGTGLVRLTAGDGTHTISYSPDGRFYIDSYSRMDMAPVTELHRTSDGQLVTPLEKGDIQPLLASGWPLPERFTAKGRDGKTDIYGVIYRPMNFDPAKKYPVIEDIYAGPQDSFCPKSFARSNNGMQMAQLGFVVVQIDGMGTSNRSKAFHDVCWHNLGDGGFPDRILWMQAAAKDRPWMDVSRVGIYGTSAGGQNALRAVEAFGDFYKAAVADCGCHDNRMDKIWWNELWMGWPIGPWYEEQSNVTNAKNLHGSLLLIVGETDHNVDPASTMQVVNALIKADKDFDLLVIPNADHGQDGAYGDRRRKDFFVRHLLGVEPRAS